MTKQQRNHPGSFVLSDRVLGHVVGGFTIKKTTDGSIVSPRDEEEIVSPRDPASIIAVL